MLYGLLLFCGCVIENVSLPFVNWVLQQSPERHQTFDFMERRFAGENPLAYAHDFTVKKIQFLKI